MEEVPRGQVIAPGEISDAEVHAVMWTGRRVQATRRPETAAEVHLALFADTHADTPEDAQKLGWS